MKKIFLTMLLAIVALSTTACSMVYARSQYDYEETYSEDYAYLDDYALVDWDSPQYDLQYSYYDSDRVFLVIYGNRIYIIPYDYFYHYIYPRFRMRIVWRSYDWFCGIWGYNYYNNLWSHWYYRHNRPHWRPHFDYYIHHRNNGHNRPFIIRKDGLKRPEYRQQRPVQPRRDTMRAIPRNERRFVPRGDFPRSFNGQNRSSAVKRHFGSPTIQRRSAPPPVKKENEGGARRKR